MAIELCETIYYNLRQSRGGVDQQTLSFAGRLTRLLKRAGRIQDACRVHADVVGDLVEHFSVTQWGNKDERLREAADANLDGMRRCGWASRHSDRECSGSGSELYERLGGYGSLSVPSVEKWGGISASNGEKSKETSYSGLSEWMLNGYNRNKAEEMKKSGGQRDFVAAVKERWGLVFHRQTVNAWVVPLEDGNIVTGLRLR
jgi:hypothetical protein